MLPVFLSYRRNWQAEVQRLAESLRLHGLRVFIDLSDAAQLSGPSFPDRLRQIIQNEIGAMLLYLTADFASSAAIWNIETPTALQRADKDHAFFLIPFFREIAPAQLSSMAPHGPRLAACNGIMAILGPGIALDSFLQAKHAEAAKFIVNRMLQNQAATNSITLGLQTRSTGPAKQDTDLYLDWRPAYPDEKPFLNSGAPATAAMRDLVEALGKTAIRHIVVYAKAHLSAGIALGSAFSRTAEYKLEIEHYGQLWSSDDPPQPFDLEITSQQIDPGLPDISLTVAITRPEAIDSVERAQSKLGIRCGGRIVIEPKAGGSRQSVPSGGCATSIAGQVAAALISARAKWGLRRTHLFIAAPFALAVLIGQELNALGPIDVYEHDKATDEYVKTFDIGS
jgi:hypothetical protein